MPGCYPIWNATLVTKTEVPHKPPRDAIFPNYERVEMRNLFIAVVAVISILAVGGEALGAVGASYQQSLVQNYIWKNPELLRTRLVTLISER